MTYNSVKRLFWHAMGHFSLIPPWLLLVDRHHSQLLHLLLYAFNFQFAFRLQKSEKGFICLIVDRSLLFMRRLTSKIYLREDALKLHFDLIYHLFYNLSVVRSLTIFYMIAILVLLHQNVGGMCPSHSLGSKTWIPIFQKKFQPIRADGAHILLSLAERSTFPVTLLWLAEKFG